MSPAFDALLVAAQGQVDVIPARQRHTCAHTLLALECVQWRWRDGPGQHLLER